MTMTMTMTMTRYQQRLPLKLSNRLTNDGFTIVEFLIASLISSILVLVVFNIFMTSLKSQSHLQELVGLETNTQAGLLFIARSVELAGYSEDVNMALTRDFLFPKNAIFGVGQAVALVDNGTRLYVRMYGGSFGVIRDCRGNPLPASTMSTREITLVDHQLICRDFDAALDLIATTTVAQSIEQVQFLIELKSTVNPDQTITTLNSSTTNMQTVSAVSVDFISRSITPVRRQAKTTTLQLMSGETIERQDRYFYHKVSRVISTKNIGSSVELS